MQNIITQVPQNGDGQVNPLLQQQNYDQDYYNNNDNIQDDSYGNSLIHLNIQENHYFITRDQLMSLPESLLLCLFPSGVFLDRDGQVITNLTPEDEVYIINFAPECFEYIMNVFTKAHDDLINHPVDKLFERPNNNSFVNTAKGFFGLGSNGSNSNNITPTTSNTTNISQNKSTNGEHDLLHQKPVIIVLREDLDYYCVPLKDCGFETIPNLNLTKEQQNDNNDDLLQHFMAQIKIAAGSYLTNENSIFQGLFSSNRLKYQNLKSLNSKVNKNNKFINSSTNNELKLGPAEQHLMDMLCSSGFTKKSQWGNRTQEPGKTVISSLSLCRLENESTELFRNKLDQAIINWENQQKSKKFNTTNNNDTISPTRSLMNLKTSLSRENSNNNLKPSNTIAGISNTLKSDKQQQSQKKEKRKSSRLSQLTRSSNNNSTSFNKKNNDNNNDNSISLPKVYDLVPKPDINAKLLLFWRKPARKCWWGDEEIDLEIEIYGHWVNDPKKGKIINLKLPTSANLENELNMIKLPVRLHIRRVWTLELSVIGVQ
ncbi:hypothetical protein C6P44_003363 [Monosporozyma unispora]|nr:hypothetical protein C6P44_003363 [Kazachstania unispora]